VLRYKYTVLAAVAAVATITAPADAQRKVGQTPEPGVETTATVGSTVLEKFNIVAISTPRLRDDLEVKLGIQGRIVVPSGSAFRVEKANPLKACTMAEDTYIDNFVGPRGSACLFDTDMDGTFDKAAAEATMFTSKKLKPPVPYDVVDTPVSAGSDFLRQRLVYLGAAGGTLRLSYREFSHDMARPAFTEELSFPLEPTFPQTVTWRDTRITLLGIGSDGLRYRVEPAR
jgi:hypothetical protein